MVARFFGVALLVLSETAAAQEATAQPSTESAPAPQTEADPQATFYKGELGTPGASELENPNDAFFIGAGYYNLGGVLGQHYARITPELDMYFDVAPEKQLVSRLHVPVNMLLYDRLSDSSNHGLGETRSEDYDEARDYVKVIKELRLGRKEDKLFVNVGLTHGVSIGHGTVMRRYNANLDPDRTRVGLQFDAYNDYGGFETFAADLTGQVQVFGGLAFVKPLSLLSDNAVAKSWSLGVHYTTDLSAPKSLLRDDSGAVELDDSGFPKYKSTTVGIIGVDTEVKPIRLGNLLDLKLYADYSQMQDAGSGMTMGALLRSNIGARPFLSALRMRLEGRLYDSDYVPQYFDSLYDVQRFQILSSKPTGLEPTKYAAVTAGADGNGKASVYAEATYALVDEIVLGVGLERFVQSSADPDSPGLYNLLMHVEIPAFELLRLYGSYEKFGYEDLGDSFAQAEGDSFAFEPNTVLTAQARMMILPIMFLSAGARTTFQWDETFRDPDRNVVGAYVPRLDYIIQLEVGYELN